MSLPPQEGWEGRPPRLGVAAANVPDHRQAPLGLSHERPDPGFPAPRPYSAPLAPSGTLVYEGGPSVDARRSRPELAYADRPASHPAPHAAYGETVVSIPFPMRRATGAALMRPTSPPHPKVGWPQMAPDDVRTEPRDDAHRRHHDSDVAATFYPPHAPHAPHAPHVVHPPHVIHKPDQEHHAGSAARHPYFSYDPMDSPRVANRYNGRQHRDSRSFSPGGDAFSSGGVVSSAISAPTGNSHELPPPPPPPPPFRSFGSPEQGYGVPEGPPAPLMERYPKPDEHDRFSSSGPSSAAGPAYPKRCFDSGQGVFSEFERSYELASYEHRHEGAYGHAFGNDSGYPYDHGGGRDGGHGGLIIDTHDGGHGGPIIDSHAAYGLGPMEEEYYPDEQGLAESEQIHRCPAKHCRKAFGRRYNLQSHLRCHSGERPFRCHACSASFSRKHDLHRHTRSLHSNDRPHLCSFCNLSFARADALKRHMVTESRKEGSRHSMHPLPGVHARSPAAAAAAVHPSLTPPPQGPILAARDPSAGPDPAAFYGNVGAPPHAAATDAVGTAMAIPAAATDVRPASSATAAATATRP